MTNKEYIENNNISFSEVMKMYDNKMYPCINDWLEKEHNEHKFKVGDIVILNGMDSIKGIDSGIGVVIDVKDKVYYKFLKRSGNFCTWMYREGKGMYHNFERDVYIMIDESKYEKIF